jgi:hypothetical protein
MIQRILELCSSDTTQYWLVLGSDLSIALAYFAIPLTMAIVLRQRKQDIPYPWLWLLFVAFIVACGLTHVAHVWSAIMGPNYLWLHAWIGVLTALASVGTAFAFIRILPEIRDLPSPWQQKAELERLVAERTREKDALIREIHHRIGNQLQIISSLMSIEERRTKTEEVHVALGRIRSELQKMADEHSRLSLRDYLENSGRENTSPLEPGEPSSKALYVTAEKTAPAG